MMVSKDTFEVYSMLADVVWPMPCNSSKVSSINHAENSVQLLLQEIEKGVSF